MDRRERFEDYLEALTMALEGFQSEMWTALPGIINSYDAAAGTCTVQPSVQARIRSPNSKPPVVGAILDKDNWWWVTMPLLVDVPVMYPSGGGYTMTFPIAPGDECLVVFSSRSIDGPWQTGAVSPQAVLSMHDLSDGFAFVGWKSVPKRIAASANSVQLRKNDGSQMIELAAGGVINALAPGGLNIDAAAGVNITGNVVITGTLVVSALATFNGGLSSIGASNFNGSIVATGEGTFNGGHTVSGHIHGGVQTGGGSTGTPTG